MKKSIKLIIICLLLCICCFGVISCHSEQNTNNMKQSIKSNNAENIERINNEVNNFLNKEGYKNVDYNHNNKTITINHDLENKKEEIKGKVEGYIKKDVEVIINN